MPVLSVEDWTKTLQSFSISSENENVSEETVAEERQRLAILIKTELCAAPTNQTVLNLAVRTYCQLLQKRGLQDEHFGDLVLRQSSYQDIRELHVLYAFVQVDNSIAYDVVTTMCWEAFKRAVESSSGDTLLILLKMINLACKKNTMLSRNIDLSLEHVYHCLQSNQVGMREEILILFGNTCKQSSQRAFEYFQFIMTFWPWTNRNKLYLLSSILNSHSVLNLLESAELSVSEFFAGLRISLSYKRLLAASQYLVKTLSNQNSKELVQLSADVLTNGSCKEVQNFFSQWFSRISQKDELFQLVQCKRKPEINNFLENSNTNSYAEKAENFRLILVFNMFSRQIFAASRLHFFKISTELITNCFHLEIEAQMLIFKFIVDNLCNFSIEDCLEFVLVFVQHHKSVDNPQHRNGILGRMPAIINYISKMFSKLGAGDCTTLEASVIAFFQQLQNMIDDDLKSELYQPKIFALKLFEILLKSLYSKSVAKNAKNCSLIQNQKLGCFLIERQVFDATQMSKKLFEQLNDPQGFDDALELIVVLLAELQISTVAESSVQVCKQMCQRVNVDECVLSPLYAQVSIQINSERNAIELFQFALNALKENVESFDKDPLFTCKKNHLFGFVNVINEVVCILPVSSRTQFDEVISLLQRILNIILLKLNLSNVRNKRDMMAADFQDMDESLQLLVEESAATEEESAEKCRKFLLMSFWLTLKACCDLGTTIGSLLVPSAENNPADFAMLAQCLQVNIAVLTRCRHKGAIEAAGLSIGVLTRSITSHSSADSNTYALVHNCLDLLFDEEQKISTSRRGAGFSIMFLHVVKNEAQRQQRPLLKRALNNIFKHLGQNTTTGTTATNCDRLEVLTLHYLCVLVKDTELREAIAPSYNEIMMAAIAQIDHSDWMVCNAALQLMGALIPKIVGQSHAHEFDTIVIWEPSEITYSEILCKMPKACDYVLEYCSTKCMESTATRSIILFLGWFAKVEHLRKSQNDDAVELQRFRELMWRLLRHGCEKVRQLAAVCFVRAHDIRTDLPHMLLAVIQILFRVHDENFFQGLLYTLIGGISKLKQECKNMLAANVLEEFMEKMKTHLSDSFQLKHSYKLYTLCKLLNLLLILGLNRSSPIVQILLGVESAGAGAVSDPTTIGRDLWLENVAKIPA